MRPLGSLVSSESFQSIAWGVHGTDDGSMKHGVIAGGMSDGSLNLWKTHAIMYLIEFVTRQLYALTCTLSPSCFCLFLKIVANQTKRSSWPTWKATQRRWTVSGFTRPTRNCLLPAVPTVKFLSMILRSRTPLSNLTMARRRVGMGSLHLHGTKKWPRYKSIFCMFNPGLVSNRFLDSEVQSAESSFCIVTHGSWDIAQLISEAHRKALGLPDYAKRYIDLREVFRWWCKENQMPSPKKTSLVEMCRALNIQVHGNLHSGLDDSITIAKIIRQVTQNIYIYIRLLTTTTT